MANEEQLSILKQGVEVWNKWRDENPDADIHLQETDLSELNLSFINLEKADLFNTNLAKSQLTGANLRRADLRKAHLFRTKFSKATLSKANFYYAFIREADFSYADLRESYLREVNLYQANFIEANLRGAKLIGSNLEDANLSKTDLTGADLSGASLIGATIEQAIISGSSIYGINVWDLVGEFSEQKDLVITPFQAPVITVDNVKVAQFIYLILNNHEIRDVINTLTSKSVLILGRFALPERKAILDGLREKLREYDLLPIVFDFDRPSDKDFTETIKTLAGLCYFVIADVTNPKSSPLELQAVVPDYQIPFVPIIQEGESPFAMMVDLQKKYNWVLNTVTYDSMETLIKVLKPLIIDPAMKKRNELRIIKAQVPEVISGKDFLAKGKE